MVCFVESSCLIASVSPPSREHRGVVLTTPSLDLALCRGARGVAASVALNVVVVAGNVVAAVIVVAAVVV